MSTTISVSYDELAESVREGMNDQGPWAVKSYLVDWNDRYRFVNDMRGTSSTTGPTGPWVRIIPYQYPPSPNLYALSLEIEPYGDIVRGSTPIEFTKAKITVNFGCPPYPYQQADDPLYLQSVTQDPVENESLMNATQKITYGYETYPVPNSSVKFQADGAVCPTPMVKRLPVVTITFTWKDYPVQPFGRLKDFLGTVNTYTFLGCPPGTIFLDALDTNPHFMSDGTKVCDVTEVFKYRTEPWRKFLRPDNLQWDYLKDSAGNYVYDNNDFSQLLLPSVNAQH